MQDLGLLKIRIAWTETVRYACCVNCTLKQHHRPVTVIGITTRIAEENSRMLHHSVVLFYIDDTTTPQEAHPHLLEVDHCRKQFNFDIQLTQDHILAQKMEGSRTAITAKQISTLLAAITTVTVVSFARLTVIFTIFDLLSFPW